MNEFTDDELLARLSHALTPVPSRPDDTTMARLHETLAEVQSGVVNIADHRRRRAFVGLRRRAANHASALTIATVSVLLSGGVAAAAVATDTMPGPIRSFAYDLGLPVTSPLLYQAKQHLVQLQKSITQQNHRQADHWGRILAHDLEGLDTHDLSEIRSPAEALIGQTGISLPSLPPLSGTTTTSVNENSTATTEPETTYPGPTSGSTTTPSSDRGSSNSSTTTTALSGESEHVVQTSSEVATVPTEVNSTTTTLPGASVTP